jgi:hypothetical protein
MLMRFPILCTLALVACSIQHDRQTNDTAAVPSAAQPPASTSSASTAAPVSAAVVPVQVVSPDEDIDACSVGSVRDAGVVRQGRVAVRAGPGLKFDAIDSLKAGAPFFSCDGAEGWVGIVYRRDGDPPDTTGSCGALTSPIAEKRAYRGPCRSGWIADSAQQITGG